MNYETSAEIEIAVAHHFGIRKYIIVPNLSWGLNIPWELDLGILTKSGYLWEVEIKVSKSDLIRDKRKHKWNYQGGYKIRQIWFAIPAKLMLISCAEHIPDNAGILVIGQNGNVEEIRKPKPMTNSRKLTESEQFTMARLGAMRIWALKTTCLTMIAQKEMRG